MEQMDQIVFKIQDEKIFVTDPFFYTGLNIAKEQIQGKNYKTVLSTYINKEVAKKFSELMKGKRNQIYTTTTVSSKEKDLFFLSIFGYRFETETGVDIFGAVVETGQLDKQLKVVLKDLADIQHALDHSVILAITNRQGKITYVNNHFCEISGYSMFELIGNTHQIINSGYHSREYFKEMWRTIGRGNVWKGEIRNQAKDGSYYWVDTTIVPIKDEDGNPMQYIAIRFDITDKKRSEERIRFMAYYDHLTGLPNRRMFDQNLIKTIERAKENNTKFGTLFIDLDSFKYVNDTLGHLIGDKLLIEVSKRFKKIIDDRGMVARLSGDEFAIIVYAISNLEEMKNFAEAVVEGFKEPFVIRDFQLSMTGSVGVATYPEAGTDAATIMRHADLAMYRVKGTLKNDYKFFDMEMNRFNERVFQIQNDLRKGLDESQFYIVYQPKVCPTSNLVVSLEALIRWKHDEFGEISPGEFIPLAEEVGMINAIGDWVAETVCKQINIWASQGYELIPVAINLSASQFLQVHFADSFLINLEKYQIDPSWIQIEITESMFIDNEKRVREILEIMKAHGIKIALDDFGTGYSSLAYLRKLDLDILKIDRSLIQGISTASNEKEIAATVIQLGKSLGMTVVAEGVETKEELDILVKNGVDVVQGYYYSKPLRAVKMDDVLRTKRLP